MILVRVKHLPTDSQTQIELGASGWLLEHYLAAHVFQATAGEPHPALPKKSPIASPARAKALRRARARKRERDRAIAAGEIT